jgi:D-glycero-D-manno-heptose 1,7-bisphosphate phosphatase
MLRSPSLYCYIARKPIPGTAARPGIFLDRDGVVVEESGYLSRPEDVRFIPGAIGVIVRLNTLGIPVVLVTNQSGIGRGLYNWDAFEQVQERIREQVGFDAEIASGFFSRTEPEADPFRKPNPGMLELAAEELSLDLSQSWLVGDKPSDIETALRAGLKGAVHVLTGYGAARRAEVVAMADPRIHFADSLAPFINQLIASEAISGGSTCLPSNSL